MSTIMNTTPVRQPMPNHMNSPVVTWNLVSCES